MAAPSTVTVTVRFFHPASDAARTRVADAELCFRGGPLDDTRLLGIRLWQNANDHDLAHLEVELPGRTWTTGGVKRRFDLLRGNVQSSEDRLRRSLVQAYLDWRAAGCPPAGVTLA